MPFVLAWRFPSRVRIVRIVQLWEVVVSVPLRIVTVLGGALFVALALGIVLPPMLDELNSDTPVDFPGGSLTVILMLLFFGAAPAFVGVRLIWRAMSGDPVATPQTARAAAIAETPAVAQVLTGDGMPVGAADQSPIAFAPAPVPNPPPPPSARREMAAAVAAATLPTLAPPNRPWSARIRAQMQNPLGLALVVAVVTIPLMILLRPAAAYVGTLALTIYAIAVIGMSAVRKSWLISALTSAGTGMMLFIVLAMTAGAMEQGEGNNPVFMLPGALFYLGIGLTGIARLFTRR